MGKFRDSNSGGGEPGIDMSSMLDCVFILLIFFIVTTTFIEEPGVKVNKPFAASAKVLEKNSIFIALTPDGEVVYGGREIGVVGDDGDEVAREFTGAPPQYQIVEAVVEFGDEDRHARALRGGGDAGVHAD